MKRRTTTNVALAAVVFYLAVILIALFVSAMFSQLIDPKTALCGAFGIVSGAMWLRVYRSAKMREAAHNGTGSIQAR